MDNPNEPIEYTIYWLQLQIECHQTRQFAMDVFCCWLTELNANKQKIIVFLYSEKISALENQNGKMLKYDKKTKLKIPHPGLSGPPNFLMCSLIKLLEAPFAANYLNLLGFLHDPPQFHSVTTFANNVCITKKKSDFHIRIWSKSIETRLTTSEICRHYFIIKFSSGLSVHGRENIFN